MDIEREINELKREKAEFQSQLANATGDERIALLNAIAAKDNAIAAKNNAIAAKDNAIAAKDNAIAAKDNQLTELYKHLPAQAPPAGKFTL